MSAAAGSLGGVNAYEEATINYTDEEATINYTAMFGHALFAVFDLG